MMTTQRLASLLISLMLLSSAHVRASSVCPAGSVLEGIDVSSHNGIVDWSQVKGSDRAFAFATVSSGLTPDPSFEMNYAAIKDAGMIRGAIQSFRPGQDPTAQADLLLAKIGAMSPGDLPPVLDVEVTDGQPSATVVSRMQTWIAIVRQATGVNPIVYTGRAFWNGFIGSSSFATNPLFVAAFEVACPNLPNAWQSWQFWQYDLGSVSGIASLVNLDRFNGSVSDLEILAGISQVVQIDIKPGDGLPAINPMSKGRIPVAILSDAAFNASTEIDTASLTFGHTGNERSLAFCNVSDVNGDGIPDLDCHFNTEDTGFQSGDITGVLKGMTLTGIPVRGTGSISVVP
jgi:GH25 family lysozyme M1 (1,4-beta-N-acetylmuramidase)